MRLLLLLACCATPLAAAEPSPATQLVPADTPWAVRIDIAALLKKNPVGDEFPPRSARAEMNRDFGVPLDTVESVVKFEVEGTPVPGFDPRRFPTFPEPVTIVTTLKPFGKPELMPWQKRGRVWMFSGSVSDLKEKEPVPPKVGEGEVVFGYNEVFIPLNDRQFILASLSARMAFTKGAPAPKQGWIHEALAGKGDLVFAAADVRKAIADPSPELPPELLLLAPLVRMKQVTAIIDYSDGMSMKLAGTVAEGDGPKAVKTLKALQTFLSTLATEGEAMLAKEERLELGSVLKPLKAALDAAEPKLDGNILSMTIRLSAEQMATMNKELPPILADFRKKTEALRGQYNLKQLALAMMNYESANGKIPSFGPIMDKKTGKPLLSWRVAILPYVEQGALYSQFKLDEPWDSDHNKKLIAKMPEIYVVPGTINNGKTHYRVFAGKGAGFDADAAKGVKYVDITDGTSNTIMIVEAAEAAEWTKPEGIEYDPNDANPAKWLRFVDGVCQVVYFDGSVHRLAKDNDPKSLHALITSNGGEIIPMKK